MLYGSGITTVTTYSRSSHTNMFSMQLLGMQCHLQGKPNVKHMQPMCLQDFFYHSSDFCLRLNTIFTEMQDEVFSLNLALECEVILNLHMKRQMRSLWTDNVQPNHSLHHQIIAYSGDSLPIFWDNLSVHLEGSRNPEQRIEHN
jgi:hypothetical protein